MMSLDFRRSPSEHVMTQLVVGVYVDDLVITSSDHDDIKLFKDMSDAFKMSDFRLLHYYLGIEVK
jgi:hypothetical protein